MAQEYRSDKLDGALKALHTVVDDIEVSVIVNNDGLLVSAFPPTDDHDQVAAMSATLVGIAERTLRRLDQGDLERFMMEGEIGVMIVYPAGRASLAVLVSKEAQLSRVLYAARRTAAEIEHILAV